MFPAADPARGTNQDEPPHHNLPPQATPFIGREAEVALVVARLRRPEVRLLTLTGPGGTGKTRLALRVAAELLDSYLDGVYFVPLAAIRDPRMVAPTIAQTFELGARGGGSILPTMRAFLADKHLLLVLDNFEQVVDAAPLLSDLLEAAPGSKLLVTSREILRLYGEQVIVVPPMAVMAPQRLPPGAPRAEADLVSTLLQYEGVRLFVERAQAAQADFALTEHNARAVAAICFQLDGLPLAMELAAARIRLLSPQALLARLGQRLPLLVGGPRNVPARQQTLRNTIAWSYDILAEDEQRLFRRLAVFDGGCALDALEPVCSRNGDLVEHGLELLQALADKTLLRMDRSRDGEPRIEILETIREYAWEQLVASDESARMRQQHAEFFLTLAEHSRAGLEGPTQATWLQRMERERANFRAALTWAVERSASALALRLYVGLLPFWWIRELVSEGRWWRDAVSRLIDDSIPLALHARALHVSGWLASYLREFGEAERLLKQSLSDAQTLADPHLMLLVLKDLATTLRVQGHDQQALDLFEQALVLAREVGNRWALAYVLGNMGMIAAARGASRTAAALFEEALVIAHSEGDSSAAWWLAFLGKTALDLKNLPAAARYLREGLDLFIGLRHEVTDGLAFTLEGIAALATALGDPQRAVRLFGAVELLREQHNLPLVPFDRPRYERDVAATRERLAEEIFAATWATGRNLSREQAVDEARQIVRGAEQDRGEVGQIQTAPELHRAGVGLRTTLALEPGAGDGASGAVAQRLPPDQAGLIEPLSPRELEVLRLLAQGLSNAQIAEALIVAVGTVKTHTHHIFAKLGAANRTQAVRRAQELHLV